MTQPWETEGSFSLEHTLKPSQTSMKQMHLRIIRRNNSNTRHITLDVMNYFDSAHLSNVGDGVRRGGGRGGVFLAVGTATAQGATGGGLQRRGRH